MKKLQKSSQIGVEPKRKLCWNWHRYDELAYYSWFVKVSLKRLRVESSWDPFLVAPFQNFVPYRLKGLCRQGLHKLAAVLNGAGKEGDAIAVATQYQY
eukprot:5261869-Amphidinium_carterae.1